MGKKNRLNTTALDEELTVYAFTIGRVSSSWLLRRYYLRWQVALVKKIRENYFENNFGRLAFIRFSSSHDICQNKIYWFIFLEKGGLVYNIDTMLNRFLSFYTYWFSCSTYKKTFFTKRFLNKEQTIIYI